MKKERERETFNNFKAVKVVLFGLAMIVAIWFFSTVIAIKLAIVAESVHLKVASGIGVVIIYIATVYILLAFRTLARMGSAALESDYERMRNENEAKLKELFDGIAHMEELQKQVIQEKADLVREFEEFQKKNSKKE